MGAVTKWATKRLGSGPGDCRSRPWCPDRHVLPIWCGRVCWLKACIHSADMMKPSMECDGISTQCCWLISHRPESGGEDLFDCCIEQVPIRNCLSPTSRVCICRVCGENAARGTSRPAAEGRLSETSSSESTGTLGLVVSHRGTVGEGGFYHELVAYCHRGVSPAEENYPCLEGLLPS